MWNKFCDFYFRDSKWTDLWISVGINYCGFYFRDSVYSPRNRENKNPAKISRYTGYICIAKWEIHIVLILRTFHFMLNNLKLLLFCEIEHNILIHVFHCNLKFSKLPNRFYFVFFQIVTLTLYFYTYVFCEKLKSCINSTNLNVTHLNISQRFHFITILSNIVASFHSDTVYIIRMK